MAVALQTGLLTYNGLVVVANRLLSRMSTRHGEAKAYRQKMRSAKSYEVRGRTCVVLLPFKGFGFSRGLGAVLFLFFRI